MLITIFALFEPNISLLEALLLSVLAIVIVFVILILIIFVAWLFQKGIEKVEAKTHILPKQENQILEEDEDAVAAVLAATIDFYKETGKEPEVISIKKLEE